MRLQRFVQFALALVLAVVIAACGNSSAPTMGPSALTGVPKALFTTSPNSCPHDAPSNVVVNTQYSSVIASWGATGADTYIVRVVREDGYTDSWDARGTSTQRNLPNGRYSLTVQGFVCGTNGVWSSAAEFILDTEGDGHTRNDEPIVVPPVYTPPVIVEPPPVDDGGDRGLPGDNNSDDDDQNPNCYYSDTFGHGGHPTNTDCKPPKHGHGR